MLENLAWLIKNTKKVPVVRIGSLQLGLQVVLELDLQVPLQLGLQIVNVLGTKRTLCVGQTGILKRVNNQTVHLVRIRVIQLGQQIVNVLGMQITGDLRQTGELYKRRIT